MQKNVCTLQVLDRAARPRPHFCTTGLALITRNCYTKLCAIYWSPYHGSSAKLVLYSFNGVRSLHSNAKVIEILKKDLPLLCNENISAFPAEN